MRSKARNWLIAIFIVAWALAGFLGFYLFLK